MKYCDHCKVNIKGNRKSCPLCDNTISGNGNESEELFPFIPESYQYYLIFRIMIFISICIIALSLSINSMFPVNLNWPMLVIFGLLCVWISLALVIRQRHNIPKSITWQVSIIVIFAISWDFYMGYEGWSIEFVLPIAYVVAMIVMYVTAKVMNLGIRDFIIYLLLDGLFGIIPAIFLFLGIVHIKYPSIICVTVSIISLSAVILFKGEDILEELKKRMHV